MPRCCVLGCKNDSRTVNVSHGGVSYHRFPKEPATVARWLAATGRVGWAPRAASTLCSRHFAPQDLLLTTRGYRYLRLHAVPTRDVLSYHEATIKPEPSSNDVSEFLTFNDTQNEKKLKNEISQLKFKAKRDGLKIRRLQMKVLRLKRKTAKQEPESVEDNIDPPLVHATPGGSRKRAADSSPEPPQRSPPSTEELSDFLDSDDDLASMLRYEQNKIKKQKIKINSLQRKLNTLKMTIWNMENIYSVLREKLNFPEESIMDLQNTQVKVSELAARRHTNRELSEVVSKLTYSPELRCFALTLHMISAQAYDYVRKTFKTSLPHPSTLKHWYLKTGGEPGFTKEAFVAMKRKADATDQPILAALALREMDVRRCVQVDGRIYGYVDMGTGLDTDMANEARNVLVLFVTAINCNFKVPVAYFFTDSITAEQSATIVKLAIEMAHDAGVRIVALNIEASPARAHMANRLGCNLQKDDIAFKHPVTEEPVVVVLDPSSLLENLQRAFSDFKTLFDRNGKAIEWKYLKQVEKKSYSKDLHHIDYQKVRNVANKDNKLFSPRYLVELGEQCKNKPDVIDESDPTATFVTLCISIYDMFFSDHENILTEENSEQILALGTAASKFISAMTLPGGGLLTQHLGFSLKLFEGIKVLYSNLIDSNTLKSLPLRRLSQDYLKHFLCNIKIEAGYKADADPTPKMFVRGYKKVVAQIQECTKMKSLPLEQIYICQSPSPVDRINRISGLGMVRDSQMKPDHLTQDLESLSINNEDAITEIAVHIVQELNRRIYCDTCSLALVTPKRGVLNNIIVAMDRRQPLYASKDVIKICKTADMFLKVFDDKASEEITAEVMREFVDTKIFDDITRHQVNRFPESNHVTDLMKAVLEMYIKIHNTYRKKKFFKDKLKELKEMWTRPNARWSFLDF